MGVRILPALGSKVVLVLPPRGHAREGEAPFREGNAMRHFFFCSAMACVRSSLVNVIFFLFVRGTISMPIIYPCSVSILSSPNVKAIICGDWKPFLRI